MRTTEEIRMLRGSKGYLKLVDLARALENEGVHVSAGSLGMKEKGKVGYSPREVEGLARVLGISLEEAFSFFV